MRMEVSTTSPKTGVAYDNRSYHPAAVLAALRLLDADDALSRNARSAAAMVKGALLASRRGNTPAGTLAVSEQKVCWPANHHPPTQPAIPRMHRRSGDQETRDGAYTAPQLRHPSARSRHRYQKDPRPRAISTSLPARSPPSRARSTGWRDQSTRDPGKLRRTTGR